MSQPSFRKTCKISGAICLFSFATFYFVLLHLHYEWSTSLRFVNSAKLNINGCNYNSNFDNNYSAVASSITAMCINITINTGTTITITSSGVACPLRPILTMIPGGRLGNLIGTYATLFSLARQYSYHAVVPRDVLANLKKIFPALTLPSSETIPKNCGTIKQVSVPGNTSVPRVNVQLPIYAAELAAFHPYRDALASEFRFHPMIQREAQDYLIKTKKDYKAALAVGVHVRRTDYVKYIQKRWNDTVVYQNYIHKAMESLCNFTTCRISNDTSSKTITSGLVFVILSDDITWCKQHLNQTRYPIVFPEKKKSPALDMAILSLCDHVIISVGTFGFWSAYLSQKNVTYPNKNAVYYEHFEKVFLPGWTKLSI